MLTSVIFCLLASAILLAALPGMAASLPWPEPILWAAWRRGRHPAEYWASRIRYDDLVRRAVINTGRRRRLEPVKNYVLAIVVEPVYIPVEREVNGEIVTTQEFSGKTVFRRKYRIRNTVLPMRYPELLRKYRYPVVVVQWPDCVKARDLRKDFTVTFPLEDDQSSEGIVYNAGFFAGANAKNRKTFGFPKEYLPFPEFMSYAEASVKMSRAVLPNGRAAFRGDLRVMVVPDGTVFAGQPVGDGFSYWDENAILPFIDGIEPIVFGLSRQNGQIWQNLAWPTIQDDAEEIVDESWAEIAKMDSFRLSLKAINAEGARIKNQLIEANPDFAYHPFNANESSETTRLFLGRRATSLPLDIHGAMAVPTTSRDYVFPVGKYMVVRWPVASNDGTSLCEITQEDTAEMERIGSFLALVQVTVTGLKGEGSLKAAGAVLPHGVLPEGIDMVTSESNFKLGDWRKLKTGKKHRIVLEDVGVTVLNVYDPSCAVGCPYYSKFRVNGRIVYGTQNTIKDWDDVLVVGWADKAGDYDGDQVFWIVIAAYPGIIQALKELDHVPTLKNPKQESPVERTPDFLINVFQSPLGWMTNIRGRMLACPPDKRVQIPVLLQQEGVLKKATVRSMFFWITQKIQGCVDVFKTFNGNGNSDVNRRKAADAQKVLNAFFGGPPAFFYWVQDEKYHPEAKWAFKTVLPDFYANLEPEYLELGQSGKGSKEFQEEFACHIPDSYRGGAIPEIYALVRPYLAEVWQVGDIVAKELSWFYGMAPEVSDEELEKARTFLNIEWAEFWQDEVAPAMSSEALGVGEDSIENVILWETAWRDRCADWAERVWAGDEQRAAAALWRTCHAHLTTRAEAGAVLYGFPEQAVEFARRGAQRRECRTLVRGILYHFNGDPPESASGIQCRIVDHNGRLFLTARARLHESQIWEDGVTPAGTLGIVPQLEPGHLRKGYVVPLPGDYLADLSRDGKIFDVQLKLTG